MKSEMAIDGFNGRDLLHRSLHRLVDVRGFTVHQAVDVVPNFFGNADVLKLQQCVVGSQLFQQFDDLTAVFQVKHGMASARGAMGIDAESEQACRQIIGGRGVDPHLEVILALRLGKRSAAQKRRPHYRPDAATAARHGQMSTKPLLSRFHQRQVRSFDVADAYTVHLAALLAARSLDVQTRWPGQPLEQNKRFASSRRIVQRHLDFPAGFFFLGIPFEAQYGAQFSDLATAFAGNRPRQLAFYLL